MIKKLEYTAFSFFLLSLPIQFGKHFWPQFSFVSGIRVDYLSPTIYLNDGAVLLLFIFYGLRRVADKKISFHWNRQSRFMQISICIISFLFLNGLFSTSPFASMYGILRFFEFLFVGRYIATSFKSFPYRWFISILEIDIIWTSLLGIWQFIVQHSIGGIFYFLGERTFYSSTLGIAVMGINGQQVLRPYATFPHPNVFAFFLVFSLLFLLYCPFPENQIKRVLFFLALTLGHIALLLTFSRVILLCYCIFLIWFFSTRLYFMQKLLWILILIIIAGYVAFFSSRFSGSALQRDFNFRTDLIAISLSLISRYPIIGVGLNNFFIHELPYQRNLTPTLLQPVHSIYLLAIIETGIIAAAFFLIFLYRSLKRVQNALLQRKTEIFSTRPVYILLILALIVGLFDHYLLTVQQGQLLFTFIVGLCWRRTEESKYKASKKQKLKASTMPSNSPS